MWKLKKIRVGNGKYFFLSLYFIFLSLINLFTQPSWTRNDYHYHDTCHFEECKKKCEVFGYNYLSDKYNVKMFSRKFSDGFLKKYAFNNNNQLVLLQETDAKDTNYLYEEKYFYSKTRRLDSIYSYLRYKNKTESTEFKKYIYTLKGKIKKVKKNDEIIIYNYDSLNRIKERNSYSKEDTISWIVSYFKKPGKSMTLIQKDSTNYYKYIYNDKNKLLTKIDGNYINEYYYWDGKIVREIRRNLGNGYIASIDLFRYKNNEAKYYSNNAGGDFFHTFTGFNSQGLPVKVTVYDLCKQYAPDDCEKKNTVVYEYEFFDE